MYAIVDDIARENDAVLHLTSPFHHKPVDIQRDLFDLAVNGTLNILQANSGYAPTVQRVVITSSFSAVVNIKHPEKMYRQHHFNLITLEEAYGMACRPTGLAGHLLSAPPGTLCKPRSLDSLSPIRSQKLVDDTPTDLWELDTAPSKYVLGLECLDLETCAVDSLKLLIN